LGFRCRHWRAADRVWVHDGKKAATQRGPTLAENFHDYIEPRFSGHSARLNNVAVSQFEVLGFLTDDFVPERNTTPHLVIWKLMRLC
jgi:hypothetical protein